MSYANVGMMYPVFAPLVSHEDGAMPNYGTGRVIHEARTATVTREFGDNPLHGDDRIVDDDNGMTGLRIEFESTGLDDEDRVVGTFYFICGKDIEPTYKNIDDGDWLDDSPYGVVHRVAGDGSVKGIGSFCVNWAFEQCGHLRIDTHGDNTVMQNMLKKLGFTHCGTIYVHEDNNPRLAYEKISK
jgi:hypothetical protein